ncbi:tetratricopeptide repeat protein [Emticicia sp. TH156]|uniref:tetratricopeptide repeat protein n=1 Tax=Emticicia sp. TH156 TaxID=2067454 RepID=UPI000C76F426|nr:tetratricopeptide repeat protein [Emticicia sp. TH156]PLK45470.1 hypothetical protein C0V77_04845 [Emticicia sp. TH156]
MNRHLINLIKLGLSLGAFALGGIVIPGLDKLVNTDLIKNILQAISGNLASNFIAKYVPEEIFKELINKKHDLNHHIEKLMIRSVPEAIKLVTVKYLNENKDSDENTKAILDSLIAEAKSITYHEADYTKMSTDKRAWLNDIHECIFQGRVDTDGKLKKIENFFINHLEECYKLVFIEGLKDEKDEKPLKAFLIKSLESLERQLANNGQSLAEIKEELQLLREDIPCKSISIARDYLETEFKKLNEKLDELLQISRQSAGNIEKILALLIQLEKLLNSQPNKPPHHLTRPPFEPEVFLGREKELTAIHQKLSESKNSLLLVNGEGGVGKTSLIATYYHDYAKNYRHVAWVVNAQSITNALLKLAEREQPLYVKFEENITQEERLNILLLKMASLPKPCLLVIDNADDPDDLNASYQTLRRCSNFHILLTTRVTELRNAQFYKVRGLPEKEALALFKKYYDKHDASEEELFRQIYLAVGGNTLVIELLAKNLHVLNKLKKNYQLQDLLSDLQQKGLLGLSKNKEVDTDWHEFKEATPVEIISAMYDLGSLSSEETALLSVFSVLPPESIFFETLEQLLPESKNLEDTLLLLAQKGWLDYNKTEAAFKCSPVIQEITRKKNENLFEDCSALVLNLIEKLDYEAGTGNLINITYQASLVYSRYAESVINSLYNIYFNIGWLCERIGKYHQTHGNLEKSIIYFQKCLNINEELCRIDSGNSDYKNNLAISYSKLGDLNQSMGNLPNALEFFQKYNQLSEELYKDYPNQVNFKNGLAISYSKLGKLNQSLGNLQAALEFFQKQTTLFEELHKDYPNHVDFKNGLAISYSRLGDLNQAMGNLPNALTFFQKYNQLSDELYRDYPNQVDFKNGLAISYSKLGELNQLLGNLQAALEFFQKDFIISEELYKEFPNQVSFKNGMAISYEKLGVLNQSLGNLQAALEFFQKYNQLCEELYKDHPKQVSFKNGLAVSYSKLGTFYKSTNSKEAFNYYKKAEKLWSELVEAVPQAKEYQNNLNWAQNALTELNTP